MEGDDYNINMVADVMRLPEIDFRSEPTDATTTGGIYKQPVLDVKPGAYGDDWSHTTPDVEGIDWWNELPYTEEEGVISEENAEAVKNLFQVYGGPMGRVGDPFSIAVPIYNWFTRDLW